MIDKYLELYKKLLGLNFVVFVYIFLSLCLGSYIRWEWVISLSSGGS
jgi:hypothetical protein